MVDGIAGGSRGRIDAARAQASQRISTVATPKPVRLAPDAGPDISVVGSATAPVKAAPVRLAPDAGPDISVIGSASTIAKAGPPVDAEKVSKIKAAIAEGRYPVDANAIASKMIDLDLGPLA